MGRDLEDGEVTTMQGSAAKPYELKNVGGVYSCSCPAWRNQSLAIEKRSCKHLKTLRGAEAEAERTGNPTPPNRSSGSGDDKDKPPVLLAQKWEPHIDVTGWWLSEKLDGVRAYWDGARFLSRLGNEFLAPPWFVESLPETPLDGELWVGRGQFQKTVSIVRRGDRSKLWRDVSFLVFDAPSHGGVFEERIAWVDEAFAEGAHPHAAAVDHAECEGIDHLRAELARIEGLGGEGVMARQPGSIYVAGRSHTLLKVKSFLDCEAVVVGHVAGKGRHKVRLGALEAALPDGTRFSVGTGLSDREREDPPPIGQVITVRYQELSRDGVPRFPAYVGVRADVAITLPQTSTKTSTNGSTTSKKTTTRGRIMGARYFEYSDGKSHKFWEISVEGASHTVRYGRIGASGTVKTKEFDDEDEAAADAAKLIAQKVKKGYEETAEGETEAKPVERKKPKKTDAATKAKAEAAAAEGVEGLRYFEYSDGKSNKFWEISVDGASHTVRYGRIGTDGTTKTKEFDDEDEAMADAQKLIAQKVKKGYEETEPE